MIQRSVQAKYHKYSVLDTTTFSRVDATLYFSSPN